jgi:very-short-patch-repair endonuclease
LKRKNIPFARFLRKNQTNAERLIWGALRGGRLMRFKFRRQHTIGNYIVDFICIEKKLIIELDGGQHSQQINKDIIRDKWLKSHGYEVIRFWDNDVIRNAEAVLESIADKLNPSPLSPLPSGERGNG